MKFRTWNEYMQSNRDAELQSIWADTFKALGVGGLADEDAATQSLSRITFNQRSPMHGKANVFKGKQAVSKRLENGQIFNRLKKIGDPEIAKQVELTRKWLDTDESDDGKANANASTTVSNLLKNLFGEKYFQSFIDSDFPKADQAKAQVQPQPPKQEPSGPNNSMDQNTPQPMPPGPPQGGQLGQQPQANGTMMSPQPSNPMPPKPAGAEMGLF